MESPAVVPRRDPAVDSPATRPPARLEIVAGPMFAGKTTALLARERALQAAGWSTLLVKHVSDARYGDGGGEGCGADGEMPASVAATSAAAGREVVSHDGLRSPCLAVPRLMPLLAPGGAGRVTLAGGGPVAILVDEAQFFPDLVPFCRAVAGALEPSAGAGVGDRVRMGLVVVAGLDADHCGLPFGGMGELLAALRSAGGDGDGDSDGIGGGDGVRLTLLEARCARCGAPAAHTARTPAGDAAAAAAGEVGVVVVGGAREYEPVCAGCHPRLATGVREAAEPRR